MKSLLLLCVCLMPLVFGKKPCMLYENTYSPLYVGDLEDICTAKYCADNNIDCSYPPSTTVLMQIFGHMQDNITTEIDNYNRYFQMNTQVAPTKGPNYHCKGACKRPLEQLHTLYHMVDKYNPVTGSFEKKRQVCHVIKPQVVMYAKCGGRCGLHMLPKGSGQTFSCACDRFVERDVWIYCDGLTHGCIKRRMKLPLSCGCQSLICLKDLPAAKAKGVGPQNGIFIDNIPIIGKPAVLKPHGIGMH